jgi:hypothetical protein
VKQPVQRRSGFVTETKPELKRFGIKSQPPHALVKSYNYYYFQISLDWTTSFLSDNSII